MMPDAYIGIDPGLTGCAVLLSQGRVEFFDFKTIGGAVRQIEAWLTQYKIKGVALEVPGGPQAGKGKDGKQRLISTKFFRNIGNWEGILESFYINYIEVNPRSWQSRIVPKMPIKDTKARSIKTAIDLFPTLEKFVKMKKYNNRADALLIAVYAKRKFEAPQQLNFKG